MALNHRGKKIVMNIQTRYENKTATQNNPSQKLNLLTKDELYFGLLKPNGEEISETDWKIFLKSKVTPRFPEGLTVLNADGQYMNTQEKAKLVVIIHANTPKDNRLIFDVISQYKEEFQQQSVLRVSTAVTVLF